MHSCENFVCFNIFGPIWWKASVIYIYSLIVMVITRAIKYWIKPKHKSDELSLLLHLRNKYNEHVP